MNDLLTEGTERHIGQTEKSPEYKAKTNRAVTDIEIGNRTVCFILIGRKRTRERLVYARKVALDCTERVN